MENDRVGSFNAHQMLFCCFQSATFFLTYSLQTGVVNFKRCVQNFMELSNYVTLWRVEDLVNWNTTKLGLKH